MCPTPGSGEARSHRCFRLVPSGFVAPLKGAVSQTGGGDDAEGRGRAEAEVGWCSFGYGGRRGARGGHGLAGKWRRLGGRPCPCRRPGRGGAPSGLADAGECVQRFLAGVRAGDAGRAESGPGHARPARREPWSCGPRPRTLPRLVPPESPGPPAGNLGSHLIIQDVWEQN